MAVQKTFLSKEIIKRVDGITEFKRSTLHKVTQSFLTQEYRNQPLTN